MTTQEPSTLALCRTLPGLRSLNPQSMASRLTGNAFEGLPAGVTRSDLMWSLERGGSACGLSPAEVRRLLYLVRHTAEIDWQGDEAMPVVWVSVTRMASDLGVSRQRIAAVERRLAETGWLSHRDAPDRRRRGMRDPLTGRIVGGKAWGVELGALGARYGELAAAAGQRDADWAARCDLRRSSAALRCEIRRLHAALGGGVVAGDSPAEALPEGAPPAALGDENVALQALRDRLAERLAAPAAHALADDGVIDAGGDLVTDPADPDAADQDAAPPALPAGDGEAEQDGWRAADESACNAVPPDRSPAAPAPAVGGEPAGSLRGTQGFPSGKQNIPPILIQRESTEKPSGNRPGDEIVDAGNGAAGAQAAEPCRAAGDDGPGRGEWRAADDPADCGVRWLTPDRVAAVASPRFRELQAHGAAGEGGLGGEMNAGWLAVLAAADVRRCELGIHDGAWRAVVRALGWAGAAVLVAVIDGRCQERASFVWSPPAFAVACGKRGVTGDLHLHRSVWGLETRRRVRRARPVGEGVDPARLARGIRR